MISVLEAMSNICIFELAKPVLELLLTIIQQSIFHFQHLDDNEGGFIRAYWDPRERKSSKDVSIQTTLLLQGLNMYCLAR